jgi:DNA ligase-1
MSNAQLLTSDIPADPTGWLMSEKYDGFRCIWNGTEFISRQGKVFNAPAWFKAGMPDVRLDGELWMGRGTFNKLLSTVRTKGSNWEGVKFMVFETCDMSLPVEDRICDAQSSRLPAHCVPVFHALCEGADDLDRMERQVVDGGGEGLVIRRPGSKYRPGRMGDVIKVKRLVADIDRPNP